VTASEAIACCRAVAKCSEQPGVTTRTFLCDAMRAVHARLTGYMRRAGMETRVDAAGNLRGTYKGSNAAAGRWLIGSHLDTVRDAGPFDGVLGVVLAIAIVERLNGRRLPCAIDVIGFSEEEGVRFGLPFIGSRAVAGVLDDDALERRDSAGVSVREAIVAFGLNPDRLQDARVDGDVRGYFELHLEQGPVLESLQLPLGIVSTINGQSRLALTFTGLAAHAGTTPMDLRRDALAGAAEWLGRVEQRAGAQTGLVATVGAVDVWPGAGNVVPGRCVATLDVRHADDRVRDAGGAAYLDAAREIADRRRLTLDVEWRLQQPSVPMDASLRARLEAAVTRSGYPVHVMPSGAGHDAMVMAGRCPAAMLFVRTPGGISHHPDETVLEPDVEAAINAGTAFIEDVTRGLDD
jgi:allantoate deiminase